MRSLAKVERRRRRQLRRQRWHWPHRRSCLHWRQSALFHGGGGTLRHRSGCSQRNAGVIAIAVARRRSECIGARQAIGRRGHRWQRCWQRCRLRPRSQLRRDAWRGQGRPSVRSGCLRLWLSHTGPERQRLEEHRRRGLHKGPLEGWRGRLQWSRRWQRWGQGRIWEGLGKRRHLWRPGLRPRHAATKGLKALRRLRHRRLRRRHRRRRRHRMRRRHWRPNRQRRQRRCWCWCWHWAHGQGQEAWAPAAEQPRAHHLDLHSLSVPSQNCGGKEEKQ